MPDIPSYASRARKFREVRPQPSTAETLRRARARRRARLLSLGQDFDKTAASHSLYVHSAIDALY